MTIKSTKQFVEALVNLINDPAKIREISEELARINVNTSSTDIDKEKEVSAQEDSHTLGETLANRTKNHSLDKIHNLVEESKAVVRANKDALNEIKTQIQGKQDKARVNSLLGQLDTMDNSQQGSQNIASK